MSDFQALQERQAKLESTLRWLNRTPDMREGYCRCGCGQKTSMSRGVTRLHVIGHANRKLSSVHVDLVSGCWNWLKAINRGYGMLGSKIEGRNRMRHAHQLVWCRVNGVVPEGLELDHICRNRKCVNPIHLRPVTSAQNTRYGSKAKLKESDIPQIRNLSSCGVSSHKIAKQYAVSHKCILAVLHRETWRDIG